MIREIDAQLEPLTHILLKERWEDLRGADTTDTPKLYVDLGARAFLQLGIGNWTGWIMEQHPSSDEADDHMYYHYPIHTEDSQFVHAEVVRVPSAEATDPKYYSDLWTIGEMFANRSRGGGYRVVEDEAQAGAQTLEITPARNSLGIISFTDLGLMPVSVAEVRAVEELRRHPFLLDLPGDQLALTRLTDTMTYNGVELILPRPVFIDRV